MGGSWENRKKKTRTKVIFGYQNHKFFASLLLYFLFMENIWKDFCTFLRPYSKNTFFFKMFILCRDTRVQIYPTSARTIKSTNCSAWPLLYFLIMADFLNFYDTFQHPKLKRLFYFSKFWFVAEIQGFKITPLRQVKSRVPIV